MARLDVRYMRYMDDILILAKTRWKLKKAIKVLNQTFDELKLEKHPKIYRNGTIFVYFAGSVKFKLKTIAYCTFVRISIF